MRIIVTNGDLGLSAEKQPYPRSHQITFPGWNVPVWVTEDSLETLYEKMGDLYVYTLREREYGNWGIFPMPEGDWTVVRFIDGYEVDLY